MREYMKEVVFWVLSVIAGTMAVVFFTLVLTVPAFKLIDKAVGIPPAGETVLDMTGEQFLDMCDYVVKKIEDDANPHWDHRKI